MRFAFRLPSEQFPYSNLFTSPVNLGRFGRWLLAIGCWRPVWLMVGAFAHCFRYLRALRPYPDAPGLRAYASRSLCRQVAKSAKGSPRFPIGLPGGFLAVLRVSAVSSSLVRSPARLPRWPGAGRWRVRAFPLVRNSGLRFVFSLRSPGLAAMAPRARRARQGSFESPGGLCVLCVLGGFFRAGVSARCHSLLSGNRDELRKPAQHKNGFPSRKEGNPVERANSRNRPGWPGGAAY
jgi:hypothetical protein